MNVDISIYETTVIPAIIFIIGIVIEAGLPKRYAPLVALVLGVAAGFAFVELSAVGFVAGVLFGAAAIGIHSGAKNIIQGGRKNA